MNTFRSCGGFWPDNFISDIWHKSKIWKGNWVCPVIYGFDQLAFEESWRCFIDEVRMSIRLYFETMARNGRDLLTEISEIRQKLCQYIVWVYLLAWKNFDFCKIGFLCTSFFFKYIQSLNLSQYIFYIFIK